MFAQPLGLLALLALPAIVALHLYRRRFRRREVSALFLWDDRDQAATAGRKREPLRTNASFWLELAAALCLALLLSGPRFVRAGEAEHLVLVLDGSASMGAETPEGPLDARLRDEVGARIDALSPRSRVTVLVSGPQSRVLAGPAAFPAEARASLSEFVPSAARHALLPTLALALQLSGGGRVQLFTDDFAPEEVPREVELVSLGTPLDNVALTGASRKRLRDEDDRPIDRILATVSAFTTVETRGEVRLTAEGAELARQAFVLGPGEREHLRFTVPAGTGPVRLQLTPDALAIDNEAVLAPPPPRTLALATTLPAGTLQRLGLGGGPEEAPLARLLALLPDATEAPTPEGAHLVLADGIVGGPETWVLSLLGQPQDCEDLVGPFLVEKRHPLLEGTTFEGIVWSRDRTFDLRDRPLVSNGRTALFTERIERRRRIYRLNLVPSRSSLHRSPDWPILLSNLAEARRRELPGPVSANVVMGDVFEYRGRAAGAYLVRSLDPGGAAPFEVRGTERVVVEDLTRPGLYALERDGAEVTRFGVRFEDAAESDLRAHRPGRLAPDTESARLEAALGLTETLLAALALAALLGDWWVLRPRQAREGAL